METLPLPSDYIGNLLHSKCSDAGMMKSSPQNKQPMGIAFMLIRQLTQFTVIERSRKGTGFDYWLGSEDEAGELPFQNKVRLEVSGIRKADDSRVRARIKQKIEQTNPSDGEFPAYIIIVEFSRPLSFIVEK